MAVQHPPSGYKGVMSAYALRDSFGVNSQFEQTIPGRTWTNRLQLLDRVRAMGVRHLRMSTWAGPNKVPDAYWVVNPEYGHDWHGFLERAAREFGMRFTFIVGVPNASADRWLGTTRDVVEYIAQRHAGWTVAAEAPNEYDLGAVQPSWATWSEAGWHSRLRTKMQETAELWRNQPALNGKPILGPALVYNPGSAGKLGNVTAFSDGANAHAYTGNRPTTLRFCNEEVAKARLQNPAQPAYNTEAGYTVASAPYGGWPRITEAQQAWLGFREHLTHARSGFRRSFYYNLADLGSGDNHELRFGLLRYDLTERPLAQTLRRHFALCDAAPLGRTATSLPHCYGLKPPDMVELDCERADGSHLLFLWRECGWQAARVPVELVLEARDRKVVQHNHVAGSLPLERTVKAAFPKLRVDLGHEPLVLEV